MTGVSLSTFFGLKWALAGLERRRCEPHHDEELMNEKISTAFESG